MQIKFKKPAFTLAEVMVVLLVLTILFAAFAPFITKRRRTSARKNDLWLWASRNYLAGPMDTYYKPVSGSYIGGIFFGTTPDSENDIKASYIPLSAVTIRSGYIADNIIQRQLQLRYGRSQFDDPGQFAGTFIADNQNMLFGGSFPKLMHHESDITYPSGNVSFGFDALNQFEDRNNSSEILKNNSAFGYNALSILSMGNDNTSIGAGAGSTNISASQNTLIGYNAGEKLVSNSNTLIGYKSSAELGEYNTLIGANSGNYKESTSETEETSSKDYQYNVGIGYEALRNIESGKYNVAVGSGALRNLTKGHFNVAIGYNACSQLKEQSYKTCIGYNSGPASDSPVALELGFDATDNTPRTYIGSNPNIITSGSDAGKWKTTGVYYGGDAVLEIHNTIGVGNIKLINDPAIYANTTTIINGNLIVRGKTYFTVGNILYPFYYGDINSTSIFGTNSGVSCAPDQITYSFSTTGNCEPLTPIANTSSDRRLKNIGKKFISSSDKIKDLKIYNYKFKNDKTKRQQVGVIAQDLQKTFPTSVFKGDNGFLKIRWDEMFYAVINSIKELNNKVTAYIKQNLNLEKQIIKMEKKNADLKRQTDELSARIETLKNKK